MLAVNTLLRLPLLTALAITACPGAALADTHGACDFTSTTGWNLNGDAFHPGSSSIIRLTDDADNERGSVFYTTAFPFPANASFHAFFRVRLGPNADGADGMAFVLQSNGSGALGDDGGNLGYGGIGSSVAIELDTYQNSWDPGPNQVALTVGGDEQSHLAAATVGFPLPSNQITYGWVDYDGTLKHLDVYLAQSPSKPAAAVLAVDVDLDPHLGAPVYAGFTAGTGSTNNRHDLLELQVSTDGLPCCPGAPSGACSAPLALCGPTGLCVACLSDADCGGATPVCDPVTSACAPCASAADCAGNPGGPACATSGASQGACVACTDDSTCASPTPRCDLPQNLCVVCLENADCAAPTPACNPANHLCVGCVDDSVCSGASPVCETATQQCVPGCHVVEGVDSCAPGFMCDAQGGSIGVCQPVSSSSSSSGMASSSSGGGAGGGMASSSSGGGAGGGMTSSSGMTASSSGGGGSGGSTGPSMSVPDEAILPLGGGCWCGVGGERDSKSAGLGAMALLVLMARARRRRR